MNTLLLRGAVFAGSLMFFVAGAGAASHGDTPGHGSGAGHAAMAAPAAGPLSKTVSASQCWIRLLPAPAPSGGFLVVQNAGTQDTVVTSASSPDFGMVMLHQTTQDQGMSKMAMVHEIVIHAGTTLPLKPGSYHVMLEQPTHPIAVGEHVQLDLALADGERVSTSCEIKPPTALKY
ncbi:copper chaperone PCu(A)C [Alcaligenaceae bacterium CGII-47]|nr:copper chaperone PCu(A)C [Alcaligenaceae bacterium CGII-47]